MKKFLVVLFAMVFIFAITTSAYAAYSNVNGEPSTTAPTQFDPLPMETGDEMDNYVGNANDTGVDTSVYGTTKNDGSMALDVIKSDGMTKINGDLETQRTHGSYQNNTNSCASCHQTHTAAAEKLLFKGSIYYTCTACHDGTLGFYNVFADRNMAEPATIPSAGSFGTLAANASGNPSVHLCTGTATISAAPGGNRAQEASPLGMGAPWGSTGDVAGANGTWTANFDCAECHAPHGSYSDRLLHYSPNGMGQVSTANGGLSLVNIPKTTVAGMATQTAAYILVQGTAGNFNITTEAAGTVVAVVYKNANLDPKTGAPSGVGQYVRDNTFFGTVTPWLTKGTTFYAGSTAVTAGLDPIYGKGYVKETTAGALGPITKATVSRAYVVKLGGNPGAPFPMQPIATFGGAGGYAVTKVNPSIYDEAGYGKAIAAYCAACHTDYQAGGVVPAEPTGMYSIAYRHNTTSDIVTCLKCHFAHGTNVNVMSDAKDNTVASLVAGGAVPANAEAYMVDQNPSSALKRYTNMAVCWKCHTTVKATLLINNESYWNSHAPEGGGAPLGPTVTSGNW